ncbi:MAG: SDR family NAD(P)-dependent oxidoreductase, partial [Terriglobales bacterium]
MKVRSTDRCDGFAQAPVWGLARTLAVEHPEFRCIRLDLDPDHSDFVSLAGEIIRENIPEEIALREDGRYIPRLERNLSRDLSPQRLVIPNRGSVDNLTVEIIERRAPSPGEIEVEVENTGLNFRDVLNVLGMYPGDPGLLGLEFSGRIARLGHGVTRFQPGDRVMGIAWGSFASFVNTPAALVAHVPESIGLAAAATIPNAFLTAYHCLVEVGAMKRGDRVLIHAATGGVGLAAVQLAKWKGAEIFTTAGSEEKRAYLRSLGIPHVFSSRTLDFAQGIQQATHGRGVDLVLNSFAGDFIDAGLASLAEGGKFVEIGKIGIRSQEQVAASRKNIHYSVVDLTTVIQSNPDQIQSYLSIICRGITEGVLHPLPLTVFDFEDAAGAFRHMSQAKHIGKIVVRYPSSLRISPDATYLITGGLSGIGLSIAEWLVDRGARSLVLLGRNNPSSGAMEAIERLRHAGSRVEIRTVDVSLKKDLEAVFSEIHQSMPPLRGIIHAAGVVDDGVLTQQTWTRFERVLAPKITGAWNLHVLSASLLLDFFILCSSIA